MKKTLFLVGMLSFGFAHSQVQKGKVGVNTEAPTETLDVKGTARVEELPQSGIGKIYNGAANDEKNTTFTGTRTVVADDNGVLGYVSGVPSSGGGNNGNGEVNPVDPKSVAYASVNRCARGAFARIPGSNANTRHTLDAPDGNISKESEITLDGISLRYNTLYVATSSEVQIKTDTNRLVSITGPGIASVRRFIETSPGKWTTLVGVNYDTEEWIIGTITFHNEGTMYRYTAQAWKQDTKSLSGFCHALERIGKWDGKETEGTEGA